MFKNFDTLYKYVFLLLYFISSRGSSIPLVTISCHQGCFFSPSFQTFQIWSHFCFNLNCFKTSLFFQLFFKRREAFSNFRASLFSYHCLLCSLLFYSLLYKVIILFSLNPIQNLMLSFNEHTQLSCGTLYLGFGIGRYLYPKLMCACSESSVETAQLVSSEPSLFAYPHMLAHNMYVIGVYFAGSRIRGDGYDVCTYRKTFRNTSTVTGSLDIVIRPTERNRLLCTTFIQSSKISCGKGTVFNPLETPLPYF